MTRRSFIGGLFSGFSLFGIAKLGGEEKAKITPPQTAVATVQFPRTAITWRNETWYGVGGEGEDDWLRNGYLEYEVDGTWRMLTPVKMKGRDKLFCIVPYIATADKPIHLRYCKNPDTMKCYYKSADGEYISAGAA